MLFEYRVSRPKRKRNTSESRIVVLDARDDKSALRKALKIGKRREHHYKNVFGGTVSVTFLGLIDLMDLISCERDEVWYRMFESANPRKFLPPARSLSVFSGGTEIGDAIWAAPAFARPKANKKQQRRKRRPVA